MIDTGTPCIALQQLLRRGHCSGFRCLDLGLAFAIEPVETLGGQQNEMNHCC
jgi:hypothetical protein